MNNSGNPLAGIRGFTLLEIMLVMVILAGMATLVISRAPDASAHQESKKMAFIIRQAAERARLENHIYAAAVFTDGVRIKVLNRQTAQDLPSENWPGYAWHQASLMKKKLVFNLPPEMRLTLQIENKVFELQSMKKQQAQEPQLLFFPDSEAAEFTLGFYYQEELTGEVTNRSGKVAVIPQGKEAL